MELTEKQKDEISMWLDVRSDSDITQNLKFAANALHAARVLTDEVYLSVREKISA
jgi:hypothetical protein